ncbi:hypothetical protein AAVH_25437 [Aphelenchoides avenae]|nr:hypothetical protein AAVH_25437 [Aphelenchus avenae]
MFTEDIVSFLFGWKRNVDDDAPSDVVEGPRSFPLTHSGYDRSLYLDADHVAGGNVGQLVGILRDKAVSATSACAPFFVRITGATLGVDKLPQMRHLNRVTGQHFVVDSHGLTRTTIKCITVMLPGN